MLTKFPQLPNQLRIDTRTLLKKRERENARLFIAEGEKLCQEALESGTQIEFAVVQSDAPDTAFVLSQKMWQKNVAVFQTSSRHFAQLCDAQTPQGILSVVSFSEKRLNPDENLIILDGVSDPGNVGTIIRTAEWFGFRNLLLGSGCADRFHAKTLRATMGSIFRCAVESTENLPKFLKDYFPHHTLLGATLKSEKFLEEIKITRPFGLIVGNESAGISEEMLKIVNQQFKIEGFGQAESLNVAVASGISMHYFARTIKKIC